MALLAANIFLKIEECVRMEFTAPRRRTEKLEERIKTR